MGDLLKENIHFPTDYQRIRDPEAQEFLRALINALMDEWREIRLKVDPIIEESHNHNADLVLPANNAVYFGNAATADSWRIVRSGNDLSFERYEGNNWVSKGNFAA